MALPKAKVKERLKAKFPGVNLSQKRIDAIADKLKLPEDADDDAIDERLDELNDVFSFADMARNDDRARTEEAERKKKEQQDNPTPKPSEENPKPDQKSTDTPEWAKALIESNKALQTRLEAIESGKVGDTRKSQLEAKLKDVTPKFKETVLKNFGRMKFDKDEDFDAFLEEVEEDAKEFIQAEANDGLSGVKTPVQGKGGSAKKPASKEEVDAVLNSIF